MIVIAVALLPELLTGAGSKGRAPMTDDHAKDGPPVVSYNIDLTGNAPRPATAEREAVPLAPSETESPPPAIAPQPEPVAKPEPVGKPEPVAKTEPKPEPVAKPEGKVLVQVGSFRDRKAAEIRAKLLRARSFEVTVTPNGAQPPMFRVRVGPATDRAGAEKLIKRLKVVKIDGSIVPAS